MSNYAFKVVKEGKIVAEATSEREAHKEALRVGGVVGKSALRNPSLNVRNPSGAKQRARGTRSYGEGLFVEADLSGRHARMLDKAAGVRRKSAKFGPTYTKLMHREALAEAARVRNPSEEVHIAEAKTYLAEAQRLVQAAKAAHKDGNKKQERVFWAETIEFACICWANVDKLATREATELRQEANRLRELAYKNLIG